MDCNLFEAFGELVEDGGESLDEESFIFLQNEGYHRSAFINVEALDYISIPTHLLEKSKDESSAETLDEFDGADKIKRR